MNEKSVIILRIVLAVIFYLGCVGLAIYGNTIPGWSGLGIMMLGLAGILTLLYLYNRRNR
ncbi:DUF6903 family protein [Arcanobacterium hippocoleae]|uniref:CHASE2 domain-containing sensor protein n=1 Tax=Arcanobacterium hippocoleae TaxID=149017 RepID=A0ABU1SZR3_9ACTO|nr:hypothetical protein [Arcanobacterium hippocoleae]MDR6938592.1 CHASE2 domain-containing sensor protein [Arcanobacterium hippocoleae]